MTLAIHLTDEAERRLREAAERLNVPVDQLAAAAASKSGAGWVTKSRTAAAAS